MSNKKGKIATTADCLWLIITIGILIGIPMRGKVLLIGDQSLGKGQMVRCSVVLICVCHLRRKLITSHHNFRQGTLAIVEPDQGYILLLTLGNKASWVILVIGIQEEHLIINKITPTSLKHTPERSSNTSKDIRATNHHI